MLCVVYPAAEKHRRKVYEDRASTTVSGAISTAVVAFIPIIVQSFLGRHSCDSHRCRHLVDRPFCRRCNQIALSLSVPGGTMFELMAIGAIKAVVTYVIGSVWDG